MLIVFLLVNVCCWLCAHRDEIQRIKAGNPDITHREAFSAAAKNVTFFRLLPPDAYMHSSDNYSWLACCLRVL
jgi:hypothetical protein